jgi:hypothetical protein
MTFFCEKITNALFKKKKKSGSFVDQIINCQLSKKDLVPYSLILPTQVVILAHPTFRPRKQFILQASTFAFPWRCNLAPESVSLLKHCYFVSDNREVVLTALSHLSLASQQSERHSLGKHKLCSKVRLTCVAET